MRCSAEFEATPLWRLLGLHSRPGFEACCQVTCAKLVTEEFEALTFCSVKNPDFVQAISSEADRP